MEKSTLSALIVAGGAAVAAGLQVFVLRAAKKKRMEKDEAQSKERMQQFNSEHGIEDPGPE